MSSATTHKKMTAPGGFLALSSALVFGMMLASSPATASATPECDLSFDPRSVVAGQVDQDVMATPSEEMGEPASVSFAPESGLSGVLSEDHAFHIVVDATEGTEGEWSVIIADEEGVSCVGQLGVTPGR